MVMNGVSFFSNTLTFWKRDFVIFVLYKYFIKCSLSVMSMSYELFKTITTKEKHYQNQIFSVYMIKQTKKFLNNFYQLKLLKFRLSPFVLFFFNTYVNGIKKKKIEL